VGKLPRTPYRQSVEALTDEDRARLLTTFRDRAAEPDLAYKVTRFLFATGAHPVVLSDPARWNLRIEENGTMLTWHRPKTDQEVAVPIDPAIAGWLPSFIEELKLLKPSTTYLNHLTHRFGALAGLPDLTPRTCRHDFTYRARDHQGDMAAQAMTGTTPAIMRRYSGAKASRAAARKAAADPKGLFG
jgi:integrase